jgi:hypothetical protein
MAKNRRKNKKIRVHARKQNVHGVIPGTLFGVLVLLAAFALIYLYVCGRSAALGDKIAELEKVHANIRRQIATEQYKWERELTPGNIERLISKHKLDLVWPSEDSVVRLPRNPPPHFSRQYARSHDVDIVHD